MLKLFWFFVGPLQQFFYFFDKYLFFKFISECQKFWCVPHLLHMCVIFHQKIVLKKL